MKILPLLKLMRFDRPVGFFLLMWPTLWALWLASNLMPSRFMIFIFIAGSIIMRAAGSVVNDIADRNFDGHVERTKNRPLVRKEISLRTAVILLVILFLLASLLVLQLNLFCFWLAIIQGGLTLLYPFAKRFTYLPQVVLGFVFNGALFPFAAILNDLPVLAWVLYFNIALLTVIYDTMYAMTDQEDDRKLGLKSTALLLGIETPNILVLLQTLFFSGMAYIGMMCILAWPYWLALGISIGLSIYQQYLIRQSPNNGLRAFKNNQWIGLVILIGIIVSAWI